MKAPPSGPKNPAQVADMIAKYAQRADSPSGESVSVAEMNLFVDALKLDGVSSADKAKALGLFGSGNIKLDAGALRVLYKELGITPVNPIDPPIVALYGVAINTALQQAQDAIASGGQPDMPRLQALLAVAESANADFPARSFAASPAVMAARPQGVAPQQIGDMRTATAALRAFVDAN